MLNKSETPLTPKILLNYIDVKLINSEIPERHGYLIFEGKSKANNEIHHIRVLELGSEFAKKNINMAATLSSKKLFGYVLLILVLSF